MVLFECVCVYSTQLVGSFRNSFNSEHIQQWRTWLGNGNWRSVILTLKNFSSADRSSQKFSSWQKSLREMALLTLKIMKKMVWKYRNDAWPGWLDLTQTDDQHHCGHRIQAQWGQVHFYKGIWCTEQKRCDEAYLFCQVTSNMARSTEYPMPTQGEFFPKRSLSGKEEVCCTN